MKKLLILLTLLLTITTASLNAREVTLEAKITGLYVAFFNRVADKGGLDYWTKRGEDAQEKGGNVLTVLKELSLGFSQHRVFISTYGGLGDQAFVEAIYRNALGRDGDSEGIDYWTGELEGRYGKRMSRSDMVAIFINAALTSDLTPENYPALTPEQLAVAQLRQDLITNKVTVGLAFTYQLRELSNMSPDQYPDPETDPAYQASIKIISEVTEDMSTVTAMLDFLESIKGSEDPAGDILDGLTTPSFRLTLDVNQSTVIGDWRELSDADEDAVLESILTQGSYGTFIVTGDSLTYLKTVESDEADTGVLEISNGEETIEVTVTIDALYWKQISTEDRHTIALKSDGTLWAWGYNGYGQLGDGTTTNRLIPTQESTGATNWSSVVAGNQHTIAIKSDGTLWGWGSNLYGQLGDGTTTDRHTPTQESTRASDWSSVVAGDFYTIAIKSDGTLWGWGGNWRGQLGDETTTNRLIPTQESTEAIDWRSVAVENQHTIALKSDGTLWAWGYNGYGQLGDGTTTNRHTPTRESTGATNWRSVAAGDFYTIAIKSDGTLWGWGYNGYGQLGDGTTTDRHTPTRESARATDWSSVVAGFSHTIALKSDGTLWAWGDNRSGQLGDETTTDRHTPTRESTRASNWHSIAAGGNHTIALKSDGTLWAWGDNRSGQLGDRTTVDKLVPTRESTGATDWSSIAAGTSHTVALKSDGTLWAWGYNGYGQLGDGTSAHKQTPTRESTGATDWSSVAAVSNCTIALKSDGTLWAWGANEHGQLGDGTTTDRLVPTQESTGATDWSTVAVGTSHTVAIKSDGTLWAWGDNGYGQLGDGTTTDRHTPTRESTRASNWHSIAAGGVHTIAIKSDGTLWGWGLNWSGQLGDGTITSKQIPTREFTWSSNWSSVSAGLFHTIAIKSDGTLWAWGSNLYGQLGDGTTTYKKTPIQETTRASDWSSVAVMSNHTIAIKSDGTLWGWGLNEFGQLGDGTTDSKQIPTQESTVASDWSTVAAGLGHTAVLKSDGTLWGWGLNEFGQLGLNNLAWIPTRSQPRQP